MEILDSWYAHKWLGCMLQAAQGGNPSADLQHHLQAASRAFHANRSILANHQVCVKDRLTFFHAVVTAVACFTAGHRKIFKQELAALDVAHRKLLRRVVGPPAGMDWSRPWHEILHDWNMRISIFVGQAGLKPWSHTCSKQHWKLGDPEDRHVGGTYFFYVPATLFTCAFHGPPSGIQVSLIHTRGFTSQTASKAWSEICLRHPLEFGTVFRNTTSASLGQKVMAWQP